MRHYRWGVLFSLVTLILACSGCGGDTDGFSGDTGTVVFDYNAPDGESSQIKKSFAIGALISRPPDPIIDNYRFVDWSFDVADPDSTYDFTKPETEKELVLYAQWAVWDFPIGAVIDATFTVEDTDEWERAVDTIKMGDNNKNYIIEVADSFDVKGHTSENAYTFGNVSGINVLIRGEDQNSTNAKLSLLNVGFMFYIGANQHITFRDITLVGLQANKIPLVRIYGINASEPAILDMKGSAAITKNMASAGGGVDISNNAILRMWDNANISNNTAIDIGGGVFVRSGSFAMHGKAAVSSNTANEGGGVYISGGLFTMRNSALLVDNEASGTRGNGGGVYVDKASTFTMRDDAALASNIASAGGGGGIYVNAKGFFHIANGIIYGSQNQNLKNSAQGNGGTLYKDSAQGTAEYGTIGMDGITWRSRGVLSTRDDTIKVVEGELLQP